MDGQRLANFVASRKDQSKPRKNSAGAFVDKVIDREMRQRGYGRVANKDEQGVVEEVDPAHKRILDKAKTSTPKSPKGEYDRKVEKYLKKKHGMKEEVELDEADKKETPPFDKPYKTVKNDGTVTDKSGAKHTPMSRVRDLARKAAQQQSKLKESDLTEADAKDYHTVHVNGRHWKTFETKSHAENVAKKIKGATVQKYDAERLQRNYGAKSAARNAARGKQYDESVEVDHLQEGRRANIVREAMEAAKKKKKQQEQQSNDKFNADPTLSSEIVKS
jgi:hypothetical protein